VSGAGGMRQEMTGCYRAEAQRRREKPEII
jgi:hypothetical protein